jgi:hypothetical protein
MYRAHTHAEAQILGIVQRALDIPFVMPLII